MTDSDELTPVKVNMDPPKHPFAEPPRHTFTENAEKSRRFARLPRRAISWFAGLLNLASADFSGTQFGSRIQFQ